jgi:putative flippase GtrA
MDAHTSPAHAVHLPIEGGREGSQRGSSEARTLALDVNPELWTGISQLVHYAAAGLMGTIGHVIVMAALIQGLEMPALWASTSGLVASGAFNFHVNYRWTFHSRKPYFASAGRFLTVAATAMFANSVLMYWFKAFMMLPAIPSQLVSTTVLFVMTFLLNKHWTY